MMTSRGRVTNYTMFEEAGEFISPAAWEATRPVISGEGLLAQIPNISEYATISYNRLNEAVAEAFWQPAADGDHITLWTGQRGVEEFNRAMRDYAENIIITEVPKAEPTPKPSFLTLITLK